MRELALKEIEQISGGNAEALAAAAVLVGLTALAVSAPRPAYYPVDVVYYDPYPYYVDTYYYDTYPYYDTYVVF